MRAESPGEALKKLLAEKGLRIPKNDFALVKQLQIYKEDDKKLIEKEALKNGYASVSGFLRDLALGSKSVSYLFMIDKNCSVTTVLSAGLLSA